MLQRLFYPLQTPHTHAACPEQGATLCTISTFIHAVEMHLLLQTFGVRCRHLSPPLSQEKYAKLTIKQSILTQYGCLSLQLLTNPASCGVLFGEATKVNEVGRGAGIRPWNTVLSPSKYPPPIRYACTCDMCEIHTSRNHANFCQSQSQNQKQRETSRKKKLQYT